MAEPVPHRAPSRLSLLGPSSRSPDSDSVSPGTQRPPPSSQRAPQKLQAPSPPPAPVGSDPWGGPVLGPWDPTFTSDALPFLDRLPKPKAGPRPPSMHYCEVCRVSCAGPQVRTGSWAAHCHGPSKTIVAGVAGAAVLACHTAVEAGGWGNSGNPQLRGECVASLCMVSLLSQFLCRTRVWFPDPRGGSCTP